MRRRGPSVDHRDRDRDRRDRDRDRGRGSNGNNAMMHGKDDRNHRRGNMSGSGSNVSRSRSGIKDFNDVNAPNMNSQITSNNRNRL